MKADPDARRFLRYEAVVDFLFARDSFRKRDLYEILENEKPVFMGRVIRDLHRDGYLVQDGAKSNPVFSWSEKRKDFNPGRWIDSQVFTAKVKRSPSCDRPRERLLTLGPGKLKISELLAILIRSGQQGESAIQAAEKLAALFGNDLQSLSLKARGELRQLSKAIGETAYCQIIAALELGKRLSVQQKAGSDKPYKIKSPMDALNYCRKHFERLAQEAAQEEFHVVLLDQAHQVIKTAQVSVGLTDKSLVHPREVFKAAIQESASALVLVHNHPSGDPTPSEEDKTITRELKAAAEVLGLRILDHLIVAKGRIVSMVQEKTL